MVQAIPEGSYDDIAGQGHHSPVRGHRAGRVERAGAKFLILISIVGQFFCGMMSVTANSRMIYAFSRDGALPGSKFWHRINPKTRTPTNSVWLGVVLAGLVGALSLFQTDLNYPVAFFALTGICVVGLYIAYIIPIFLRLRSDTFVPGPWNLGKWSKLVGWTSVVWVAFITILFFAPPFWPFWPPGGSTTFGVGDGRLHRVPPEQLQLHAGDHHRRVHRRPAVVGDLRQALVQGPPDPGHARGAARHRGRPRDRRRRHLQGSWRTRRTSGSPSTRKGTDPGILESPRRGAAPAAPLRRVWDAATRDRPRHRPGDVGDQGARSSATTGGRGAGRGAGPRSTPAPTGRWRPTRKACGSRCSPPAARRSGRGRRPEPRRRGPGQPGRDRPGLGPRDDGAPHPPAIVWQDRRSQAVCDRLADHADRLAEITGLELDPYFVAPKLAWLRDELTTDGVVGTTDTWLLHRLSGAFITDVATASRTLLLDLDTVAWSEEAVGLFGLDGEPLATLVANDASGRHDHGLRRRGRPVRGTCVDQQAALFAEDCRAPGEAKCTYGTGAFLLANTGTSARRSEAGLVACVAWQTEAGRSTTAWTGRCTRSAPPSRGCSRSASSPSRPRWTRSSRA